MTATTCSFCSEALGALDLGHPTVVGGQVVCIGCVFPAERALADARHAELVARIAAQPGPSAVLYEDRSGGMGPDAG